MLPGSLPRTSARQSKPTIVALGLSLSAGLGIGRELAVTTIRAISQLAVVGVLIAVIFKYSGLILGGAAPEGAAATQLVVPLALLAVELATCLILARLPTAALIAPRRAGGV